MYGRTEIVDWSMCISSPKGNIGGGGGGWWGECVLSLQKGKLLSYGSGSKRNLQL